MYIIKNWIQFNEDIYNGFTTPYTEIEPDDYFCLFYDNELIGFYKDDIIKLEHLIDMDLSDWYRK